VRLRSASARRAGLIGLAAGLLAACTGTDSPPAAQPGGASTASTSAAPATSGPVTPTATGSSTGGGETEGGQPKACSLVTGAEAAAALGRPVGAAQDRTLGVFSSCTFVTSGGGRTGTVTVQVLQSAATANVFDQIVSGQSAGTTVQQVPGVGDKAVLASGVLIFHKGTRVVTVFVYTQDKPNGITAAEIALAKKVAARV
jgi:hypothetical protein